MAKAPRKSRPPTTAPDDPAQSKRFVDMGKEIKADESPEVFEKAVDRVLKRTQDTSSSGRGTGKPTDSCLCTRMKVWTDR